MTTTTTKKQQALMADLFSTKAEKVLAALNEIPEEGNPDFVIPLLKTYKAWPQDEAIRAKATFILYHLKLPEVVPELMKALDEPDLQNEKAFTLSVFWNSGLIPTDLHALVGHALRSDYMTALEAVTVIEQMEDSADAESARDAVLDVDEYLEEHPDVSHREMLEEMKRLLIHLSNL